jgi:hypothetical protein
MALRDNRPKAFREAFLPSSGPGGYLSPTSPQTLSWFWNNQPNDSRSSLRFYGLISILVMGASKGAPVERCFRTLSDLVKNSLQRFSFDVLEISVLSSDRALEVSIWNFWVGFWKLTIQRSSFHASEIGVLLPACALEISILSSGAKNLLGTPEVHPMGVAPKLWVDFWK